MRLLCFFVLVFTINISIAQKAELLYFTDAHRIFPVQDVAGGRGGVARLKTLADQVKAENKECLLIHGGDLCGGVLFGGLYKGEPMIDAFNRIPVDICNFGQHEFDFGIKLTQELIKESKSQWFTTNLKTNKGSVFADLPDFLIKDVATYKIAFIGLTDAMNSTIQTNDLIQENLSEALERVMQKIPKVDFHVLITQTKVEVNRRLIQRFPQINLILTEEQEEYNSAIFYEGNVPIVSPAGNMSSVAHVSLEKGSTPSIKIIALDSTIKSDVDLLQLENYYREDMNQKLSEIIGELEVDLSFREGIERESLAGNLISDAFRWWHKADVGIINGGGIRSDVEKGKMSLKEVRSLLPFGNKICKIRMKIGDLKVVLKKRVQDRSGKLLQVSGIKYTYDSKTKNIDIYQDGDKIENERVISISLNNYLLSKIQQNYELLIDVSDAKAEKDYEVLRSYIKKKRVLCPKIEGRIQILDKH